MKRTTIVLELPDELAERLEAEARRTERSVAEVVEGLVANGLEGGAAVETRQRLPYVALGASGLTDTAEPESRPSGFSALIGLVSEPAMVSGADMEDYLREHWPAEIERDSFNPA